MNGYECVRKTLDTLLPGYQVIYDAMEEDNVPWRNVLQYSDVMPKHGIFKIACIGWAINHRKTSIVNIAIDLWHDSIVSILCICYLIRRDGLDALNAIDISVKKQLCNDMKTMFLEIMEKIIEKDSPVVFNDIRNILHANASAFLQPTSEYTDNVNNSCTDNVQESIRNMYTIIHGDIPLENVLWAYKATYNMINPTTDKDVFFNILKLVISNILSKGDTSITLHSVHVNAYSRIIQIPSRRIMDENLDSDIILRAVQTTISKYLTPSISTIILNHILNGDTSKPVNPTHNVRPMTTTGIKYK